MARSFLEAPFRGGAWFESATTQFTAVARERPAPPAIRPRRSHRTIFISDTHLGTRGCKAEALGRFPRAQ